MSIVRRRLLPAAAPLAVGVLALGVALAGCSSQATPMSQSTAAGPSITTGRQTASGTGSASSTVVPSMSSTPAVAGAETPEKAASELARVVGAQAAVVAAPGADGRTARDAVFVDKALVAANAQARLLSTLTAAQKADLPLSPADPVVLAVSQGPAYPRVIIGKASTAATGAAVIPVLTPGNPTTGYRIASMSRMLPGASIGQFDAVAVGSAPVGDASGLSIAPDALLAAYAGALAFPAPAAAPQPFVDDAFRAALSQGATSEAGAMGSAVTLKRVNTPVGVVAALRASSGKGAYVVGVLQRDDTLTEKTTNALTPSPAFTILSGEKVIDTKAVLRTYEFLVFHIPGSPGQATLVAAAEQLYAASGS